ncbi:probable glutathione S-transferase parA [Macadamia integrifolia]|uniref:probable glutathione S-transferase parA n=1 Tax=Macadamia integrifolia TaxID=60698 RepID=UPI001C52A13B|nr:probable glutathione S-transferase parA [Macadamia integrifolia]
MADEVILMDFRPSPFGMRARIALGEKGIKYVYKEENLADKSNLLLKMNPIHKKVPVLIHNGRPICESLNIVQYIDEVWNNRSPLLPSDPYHRAEARFWGDYIDKKIFDSGRRVWMSKGEEQERAKKQFIEVLLVLEGELGNKAFFGGDNLGFVDVSLIPFYSWFYAYETFGNFSIEDECPKLVAWARRCMQRETVSRSLPAQHQIYDFVLHVKKRFGLE